MKSFHLALCAGTLALAGGLGAAAYAQAGTMMHRDPFGNATITRAEAQAKAAALFDRLDANHDGRFDKADRAARMSQRFDKMDANHDGVLSRGEFLAAHAGGMAHDGGDHGGMGPEGMHHGMGGMKMMMAMHRLGRMDANGDHVITRDEFVAGALARFDSADANHDGKLTPEERRAAMRSMMMEHRRMGHDMGQPGAGK